MKFKIIKGAWFMPKDRAIVLWPFVIFGSDSPPDYLIRHEIEHCRQIKRLGVIRFYARYLQLLFRWGYELHPYEIEARSASRKELTIAEQVCWANGEVVL